MCVFCCVRIISDPIAAACENGWKWYNGNCYKMEVDALNYNDASSNCDNRNAIVAIPQNDEDNIFLTQFQM